MDKFYGIEKLSLVDYEGKLACTLFTGGCNFRCPFCHNSSLVKNAFDIKPIDDNKYLSYLEKRKNTIDAVVITGGEPTLMPSLLDKIKTFKNMGYLVKLDTNGTNPEIVKKLIKEKLIDYIAMDIKNSIELYPLTTGVNNQEYINNVLETINILKQNQVEYEFRTTLIDEFHSKESIEKIGELLKGANKIYLQKFIDRGTCIQSNLHEVQIKNALEYKCILEKYIPIVNLRGY